MDAWADLLVGMAAGAALGALLLAGLWRSVTGLGASRRSILRLAAGTVLRLALALAVLYLLLRGGQWERGPAALAGFLLVRTLVLHRLRRTPASPAGAGHPRGPLP